jgi:GntR family transcriptional regulator
MHSSSRRNSTGQKESAITIIVSLQSPEPIYRQIEGQVKSALLSGELEPGTELPSIRGLAQELRVSVITTKRAYEDLEREGYIRTLPGRGSFAADTDREELRSRRLEALRGSLEPVVDEALSLGLGAAELGGMIDSICKEKKNA